MTAVALLCQKKHPGMLDVSLRSDADVTFHPGAELPFADRSVASISLGDAVTALNLRDQLQLLIECRRALRPGGTLTCAEADGNRTGEAIARWAEFVGLVATTNDTGKPAWHKRIHATNETPLVSILIPSSNPAYFAECLDSAIGQSYPHIEIIVCDDCRTDGIKHIVRQRAHPRVRYEHNQQQLRARLNYEKCLSLASGEFVKFLNDDDLLGPDCVMAFVNAFQRIPDLVLATSHRRLIDAKSAVLADIPATQPIISEDRVVEGVSLLNAVVMYGLNFIGEPSTAMFRRSDFKRRPHCDGERPFHFDGEEVRGAVDLAMWSRLLVQGNAAFLTNRLSSFRLHSEQAQARPDVVARSVAGIRGLQKKWIEFGLFRRLPPHLLQCQPLDRPSSAANQWQIEALRSHPQSGAPTAQAVHDWRAVKQHPFDT